MKKHGREQKQVLTALQGLAVRESDEEHLFQQSGAYRRYWIARRELDDELRRLALRGKWAGLSPKAMADAYSEGDPTLFPMSYQTMTSVIRDAERLADATIAQLIGNTTTPDNRRSDH